MTGCDTQSPMWETGAGGLSMVGMRGVAEVTLCSVFGDCGVLEDGEGDEVILRVVSRVVNTSKRPVYASSDVVYARQ